jgi:hypothetical protein
MSREIDFRAVYGNTTDRFTNGKKPGFVES